MTQSTYQAQSRSKVLTIFSERTLGIFLGLIIAFVMLFNLYFLTRYPPVFIDESWYANTTWNWLKEGKNFDTIHAGAREEVIWPYLGNLPTLVSFALFGLGLFQARLVSWFFGVVLLITVVLVGRKMYSWLAGLLAALLLALSSPFIQASHYARPDIMLAAMGSISYLLFLIGLKDERWWAHFLSGLIVALSLDIHQNAVLIGLGLAALYLYSYRKNIFKKKGTWLFVLGGFLGLAYYAAVFILPHASNFLEYYRFSLGVSHPVPLFSLNPIKILESLRAEIGRFHFFENSLDFALIGASFGYLAVRRNKDDRLLLLFFTAVLASFVLLVGNKHDIYAIILYPYMMLMVGETLVSLYVASQSSLPQRVFTGMLIALVVLSSGIHVARVSLAARQYDYYRITNRIEEVIPPGARVMGLPHWWLGLSEYDYRSNLSLTYRHFADGESLSEALEVIRPEYIIFDTGWNGLLVEDGYFKGEGFDIFKMPRGEFEQFLNEQAEKIDEFNDPWHGDFAVYKVLWKASQGN